jgi:hypothetical protein
VVTTADELYAFLTDGEDGCTCRPDLQELVQAFQEAYDAQPGQAGAIPTHGYLDSATATALASQTGHWLPPCYGALSARCGEVPATGMVPRTASPSLGTWTAGGCRPWDLGEPDGRRTCTELTLARSRSGSTAETREAMSRLKAEARATCRNTGTARLIQDQVYDERGCPTEHRIAACPVADRNEPRAVKTEWFYEGAGPVEQLRGLCARAGGVLVLASASSAGAGWSAQAGP